MRYWTLSMACAMSVLITGVTARSAAAAEDGNIIATVSFGVGLNTAAPPPGGQPNHHILPRDDPDQKGRSGELHGRGIPSDHCLQTRDKTGRRCAWLRHVRQRPMNVYYTGIVPAGGPPPGTPATANPSNASNRVESVAFLEPGTYLVICNVRGHLLDGMYAYVRVSGGNDRDWDDKDHDGGSTARRGSGFSRIDVSAMPRSKQSSRGRAPVRISRVFCATYSRPRLSTGSPHDSRAANSHARDTSLYPFGVRSIHSRCPSSPRHRNCPSTASSDPR